MGLFKGLPMSLCGIAPFIGIKMSSFDFLMQKFSPSKDDPWVKAKNLTIGAAAGTIAVTLTYPTDLTRRYMQLNGTNGHNYTGIADVFRQIYA